MRVIFILTLVTVAASTHVTIDPTLWQIDFVTYYEDEGRRSSTLACLLEEGPCEEGDMKKIKDTIVETLGKNCADCTPEDKAQYEKVLAALTEKYPDLITALRVKYPGEEI